MPSRGNPAAMMPQSEVTRLSADVKKLQAIVRKLQNDRSLEAAYVGKGGLTIGAGGRIDVSGPATFEGDTSIGGNLAVVGTLSLPAGIIDNDALADPLSPATGHGDALNFSLSTVMTVRATTTIVVPAGFTRALVTAIAQGSAVNGTGSTDTFYVAARINGTVPPGWAASQDVPPGLVGTGSAAGTALLTSLSGSFTVGCAVATRVAGWPADTANAANVDASVLFLR